MSVVFRRSLAQLSLFHRSICLSAVMTRGRIPDRWEEYDAVGKVVQGTRFIAFKVPLNPMLSRSLPCEVKRFLPEDLPRSIKEQDRELGLVIDLTNTKRYYRQEDILNQGIKYMKIFTEGHSVPSRAVQDCFFKTVDDFLNSNEDNDHVIGVHCTHGLNRTGYLVCRYMIDRMNFKADDAIKAFNEARGHAMERQNYLSDLRREPVSDEPSPNKDRRMERKRMASATECLEDPASAAPHTDSKQRRTSQTPRTGITDDDLRHSITRQSGANNHWSHGQNGSQSGQNSRSYHGNGNHQRRGYYTNYRYYQQPMHGYDQRDNRYDHTSYDFGRRSHGYNQQGYNADQSNFRSDGSWRQPPRHDYAGQHDSASNDFSNHSSFSGPSFQPRGGRPHGQQFQGRSQHDSRREYGHYGRNNATGRTSYNDDCYQRSDSNQWRGDNQS